MTATSKVIVLLDNISKLKSIFRKRVIYDVHTILFGATSTKVFVTLQQKTCCFVLFAVTLNLLITQTMVRLITKLSSNKIIELNHLIIIPWTSNYLYQQDSIKLIVLLKKKTYLST